ncbi:MAG: hypothetical protein A2V85_05200 [Chloroflexi bacterium RBG_16_72_14]|nr:MAG: hypothetical protein A2V85_05200 [Chloroflexi bacterium RBG_16_72_14]
MRRILICTGILGGGTALTFTAAALAATILPGGTVVPGNSVMWERGFGKPGIAVPMPAPIGPQGDIEIEVDRIEIDTGAANGG